jgi:hypothetical protein
MTGLAMLGAAHAAFAQKAVADFNGDGVEDLASARRVLTPGVAPSLDVWRRMRQGRSHLSWRS